MKKNTQHIKQWEKCLEYMRDNLSEEQYQAWFASIVAKKFENGALTLCVPSHFYVETIEGRFFPLFKSSLHRAFGATLKNLYYDVAVTQNGQVTIEDDHSSNLVKKQQLRAASANETGADTLDSNLNPRNTFENYCDSDSNKLAVSVGRAIADNLDNRTFNPLFVFGETGVGKTHLIQAIGIKILEKNPRKRVLYVTARVFEAQYVKAVLDKKINDFISFYQRVDVLILDDVQEFAGKEGTQNTFYHIFNALQANDKKIIMSSDRRPSELDGMIPRLLSRFKWGMTVELGKPDYELRKEVLFLKSSQDGLEIPADVLEFIANNVTDSIRELEGVVVSLLANAMMLNQELTVDLARTVVANSVKMSQRELTFEMIAETVAKHCNVDLPLIYGSTRKREVSDARQLLMYFAKKETQLSSTNIGARLNRNHATVLHAIKIIEQRLSVEKSFQDEVQLIREELNAV